jgi:hypothetical protein
LGALDADGGAGDCGADFGVLEEARGLDGPDLGDPPPGAVDAEPEGRCCLGFADFCLPVCLWRGAAVIGAAPPIDEPGWDDTTPWPAREITAQTSTAPTTTRTSQAAAAMA